MFNYNVTYSFSGEDRVFSCTAKSAIDAKTQYLDFTKRFITPPRVVSIQKAEK